MTPEERSYDFLWLSFALLIILTLALILPLVSNDYWWYVRLGKIIWHTHAIPSVDLFSYTQKGQPFFYQSWLSGLIFYLVQKTSGIDGIFLLRGLLLGLTYALLWRMARQNGSGARISTALALASALAGSANWSHRPQILVYPLFALTLYLLWQPPYALRRLLWLPFISALWVNLHGSFPLFFALLGAVWLMQAEQRKPLGWALLASAVATWLNPHGWQAWAYVMRMLSDPASQTLSVEWLPPANTNWQMGLFFAWLLILPCLMAFSSQRWAKHHWLWYLGFGWLALSGTRYVIWMLFLLVPLSARLLADWRAQLDARPPRIHAGMNRGISVALMLLPLIFLPTLRAAFAPPAILPVYANAPQKAVEFLAETQPDGPLWADLDYSAYLIYALPQYPVWIDTRFELYPPEQWERYQQIAAARYGWDTALEEEGIRLLLLAPRREGDLIRALDDSPSWQKRYSDSQAVIYVKKP